MSSVTVMPTELRGDRRDSNETDYRIAVDHLITRSAAFTAHHRSTARIPP
jgi:hypothetical protein